MKDFDGNLAPVAGWQVAHIKKDAALIVRLQYVTKDAPKVKDAVQSPAFVLTAKQARDLLETLQTALAHLDRTAATPPSERPQH